MVLMQGRFANDKQFALYLLDSGLLHRLDFVTYLSPTQPTLSFQKRVSYSFFSLSTSERNPRLYLAGLITLYDHFAQFTVYNSLADEVSDYFVDLAGQLVPCKKLIPLKALRILRFNYPLPVVPPDGPP